MAMLAPRHTPLHGVRARVCVRPVDGRKRLAPATALDHHRRHHHKCSFSRLFFYRHRSVRALCIDWRAAISFQFLQKKNKMVPPGGTQSRISLCFHVNYATLRWLPARISRGRRSGRRTASLLPIVPFTKNNSTPTFAHVNLNTCIFINAMATV